MSFEWNTFYTHFEKKIKKEYPKCKVGRYITPKQADFPYCDGNNCGGTSDGRREILYDECGRLQSL